MTRSTIGEEKQASSKVEPVHDRTRPTSYLFWLFGLLFVLYLLPFTLVRVPLYQRWNGTKFSPALEYGFRLEGENADVVLFGDSSVLFGISEKQMSAALGSSVVNLPNTLGSLPVTGDMALRHYLGTNRPPKLIVFYFTPWNMDYGRHKNSFVLEGEEMLSRHGTAGEVARYAFTHPFNFLSYPFQTYSMSRKTSLRGDPLRSDVWMTVAASKGHLDLSQVQGTPPAALGECQLPDSAVSGHDFSTVQQLAARYQSPQTQVLIFIAPIPACKNADLVAQRDYGGIKAQPPVKMAPEMFQMDGMFAHMMPAGVPIATESLTRAVQRVLEQPR